MADMTAEQLRAELEKVAHKLAGFRCAGSYLVAESVHLYMGDFAKQVADIAARLSGMAAVPQWQPIETAPVFGHMLLWLPEFDSYAAQSWHGRHSADGSWAIKTPFSESADPETGIRKQVWVTAPVSPIFWQPSPAPPEPPHG